MSEWKIKKDDGSYLIVRVLRDGKLYAKLYLEEVKPLVKQLFLFLDRDQDKFPGAKLCGRTGAASICPRSLSHKTAIFDDGDGRERVIREETARAFASVLLGYEYGN